MAEYNAIVRSLRNKAQVTVRSAKLTDAAALTPYLAKIFQTSPYVLTRFDEYHNDVRRTEEWIEKLSAATSDILLLAFLGEEIVGNVDFGAHRNRKRTQHRGEIGMSVAEEYRGLGIGRLLLQSLIQWAESTSHPVEKIELGVLEGNQFAARLYQSLGFEEEGRVRRAVKLDSGSELNGQSYLDEIRMGLLIQKRV